MITIRLTSRKRPTDGAEPPRRPPKDHLAPGADGHGDGDAGLSPGWFLIVLCGAGAFLIGDHEGGAAVGLILAVAVVGLLHRILKK